MSYLLAAASLLSVSDAEDLGYSPDQIAELLASGAIAPDVQVPLWRPTTLEDVDRIGWRLEQIKAEQDALEAQFNRRVRALEAEAKGLLFRYEADCRAIVDAEIPRKPDGSRRKQSLALGRVTAQFRWVGESARVESQDAFLTAAVEGRLPEAALSAVRVTVEFSGQEALTQLALFQEREPKARVLHTPLRKLLADPELVLPGVDRVPAHETFSLRAASS